VESNVRGNDDRVELGVLEQVFEFLGGGQIGIKAAHMAQALLAGIAENLQVAVGHLAKISNQVWAPVTAPNDADIKYFLGVSHGEFMN
jgi:hypothetical protein